MGPAASCFIAQCMVKAKGVIVCHCFWIVPCPAHTRFNRLFFFFLSRPPLFHVFFLAHLHTQALLLQLFHTIYLRLRSPAQEWQSRLVFRAFQETDCVLEAFCRVFGGGGGAELDMGDIGVESFVSRAKAKLIFWTPSRRIDRRHCRLQRFPDNGTHPRCLFYALCSR